MASWAKKDDVSERDRREWRRYRNGFGAAMVASITLGFAGLPGDASLFNQLTPWLIFAAGMMSWGVTSGILQARNS